MSFPCCFEGFLGIGCADVPSRQTCLDWSGFISVGPEGTMCHRNDGSGGCWSCTPAGFEVVNQYCFALPNGTQGFFETWPSNCDRCNIFGTTCIKVDDPLDCDPPPPPPGGCRMAASDRMASDERQWTADLLGTVGLGLDEVIHEDGYAHTLSSELVRARAESTSGADPCRHVSGEWVVLSDGYVYGEVCSQPQWNKAESRRRSYATVRTVQDTPSMDSGYQYAVTAVHLPWWTEILYRSHKVFCEEIER